MKKGNKFYTSCKLYTIETINMKKSGGMNTFKFEKID